MKFLQLLFAILLIVLTSGCAKKVLVSQDVNLTGTNEGIIYYLPKNTYSVEFFTRLTECGSKPTAKIVANVFIDTIADKNNSFVVRTEDFGDWNDNYSINLKRSKRGLMLSANTSNSDKSGEIAKNTISGIASIALAVQTGGMSLLPLPTENTVIDQNKGTSNSETKDDNYKNLCTQLIDEYNKEQEQLCKPLYVGKLDEYNQAKVVIKDIEDIIKTLKSNIKRKNELIQVSKDYNISKNLIDSKFSLEKDLITKTEEKSTKTKLLNKLDKELTITEIVHIFDTKTSETKKPEKFIKTVFKDGVSTEVVEKLELRFSLKDQMNNAVKPTKAKPTKVDNDTWYTMGEEYEKAYKGIVYRDFNKAYLLIEKDTKILSKNFVPFIQGGLIGVAPIYNKQGDATHMVKFDENGTLLEFDVNVSKSSAEKSSEAFKGIGSEVLTYSQEYIKLKSIQVEYDKVKKEEIESDYEKAEKKLEEDIKIVKLTKELEELTQSSSDTNRLNHEISIKKLEIELEKLINPKIEEQTEVEKLKIEYEIMKLRLEIDNIMKELNK